MTNSKGRSPGTARSSARQGESSVRIPRLQAEDPAKAPAEDASTDPSDEIVDELDEAATVEEVQDEDVLTDTDADETREVPAVDAATGPQRVAARDEPRIPGGAARSGSTMTAADYARTTRQSADTTSVMPAIRDDREEARADEKPTTARPAAASSGSATPSSAAGRRARLRLVHVEPWSVTKLAFVVSVALMIVAVVAVTIFWLVLDLTGVWDQLNGAVTNVLSDSNDGFDISSYLGLPRLLGLTLVLSAINVVVLTALATIGAHLYNLAAQLLGGVELTFGDD